MQPNTRRFITPEEYLAIERKAEYKSEYYAGEMFALAGASYQHNQITMNLAGELYRQLKGSPCQSFINDMRLRVDRSGLYTYPDLVVVCGDPEFADEHRDTLLNPTVIIEVLSESTAEYDRGRKFEHYRRIDSLREYLLVAQDCRHVECFLREEDGDWHHSGAFGIDSFVILTTIGCELALEDIYDRVALPATADDVFDM